MKQFIAGVSVGALLLAGTTVFAAEPVKQFMVTLANYPIMVNGKEFKDAPILNYEGSTYVPLAKLGDIAGVNYKWNEQEKRVEIVTGKFEPTDMETVIVDVPDTKPVDTSKLRPDTKVIEPKGLVEENGETVFYAYDKDGKFKGRFTDEDNAALVIAKIKKLPEPPKLADGWIGAGFLLKIYGDVGFDNKDYVIRTGPGVTKQEVFYRFPLPDGFTEKEEEITSNGVRVKKSGNGLYFNITDLQKVGLLQ